MSSILDALKKLEAEKAAQQAEEQEPDESFHAEAAEAELVGARQPNESLSLRLTPLTLVIGGGVFAVILIAISVTVSIFVAESNITPQPVALNTAAPMSVPPTQAAPPERPASPQPSTPVAAATTQAPAAPVAAPAAPPTQAIPVVPNAAPTPILPTPDVAPLASPSAAPLAPPALPEPIAKQPGDLEPVDVNKLPLLRSSERARYGLENLRLNVLREAGPNRPNGLAIINLNKVYIGEVIPGTHARLIDVTRRGIAIEIVDTKERYYVPH